MAHERGRALAGALLIAGCSLGLFFDPEDTEYPHLSFVCGFPQSLQA
jgi:hypothetical protein